MMEDIHEEMVQGGDEESAEVQQSRWARSVPAAPLDPRTESLGG
jgi:hypothetical protein